jgi:asparagine synthetase B (glutamine-hydrolysing)
VVSGSSLPGENLLSPQGFSKADDAGGVFRLAVSSGFERDSPVWRSDAGVTVAIWGEIYTGGPLQGRSAAKYIGQNYGLRDYRRIGRLEGAYVVVLYEESTRRLRIINDPAGLRPLFYSGMDRDWSFSSFPSSLGNRGTGPDPVGLSCFLANGVFLGGHTHWENVRKLEPGTACEIDSGGAGFHRYWDYRFPRRIPKPRRSKSERLKQLDRAVAAAVGQRIKEEEPAALLLTGGHDSLGILGYVRDSGKDTSQLTAFTWSDMPPDSSNDAGMAKSSAAIAGIRHDVLDFDQSDLEANLRENVHLTEGLSDAAAYHHSELALIRRIRNDFGNEALIQGDQAFGFFRSVRSEADMFNGLDLRPLCEMPGLSSLLKPSIRTEWADASRQQFDQLNRDCPYHRHNDKKDYFYFSLRQQGFQNACRRLRLSVMPERNPLLGARVLNEAIRQHPADRIEKSLWKELVEKKFPDLVALGMPRNDGLKPWNQVLREDGSVRHTLQRHLADDPGILADYFSVDGLRNWTSGLIERSIRDTHSQSRIWLRRELGKSRTLKSLVLQSHRLRKRVRRVDIVEPPAERLALRLLLFKFWAETYLADQR